MLSSVIAIPAYKPNHGPVAFARDLRSGSDCAIIVEDDGSGVTPGLDFTSETLCEVRKRHLPESFQAA